MNMLKLTKLLAIAGGTAGCFLMCRFLDVPAFSLASLAGWGLFCLLFSYELAGSRKRVRNGIEEKSPMQLAWTAAGVLCMLVAFVFLFYWF